MASREEQEYSSQAPAGYIGDLLQQGIFPYAQTFLDQQFQNYGQADSSPFTYTGQRVADFDPREQYGMQLADQAIGSYRPYLGAQAGLLEEAADVGRTGYGAGTGQIQQGLSVGRGLTGEGAQLTRGSIPNLDLARRETAAARANYGAARGGLDRAEQSGIGATRSFDPSSTSRFYNPYEDAVVQQTLKDVREGLAQGDMGLRDEAVSGGAFGGARSRLRRGELAADTARGAAEAVAGIRSGGYEGARNAAQQAFESQQGRQGGLANLQSGLAGQEAGFSGQQAQEALARGQQFGALSTTEAQNQLARGQQLAGLELQNAQAKLARGEALNQSEQMAVNNQMQRGQQLSALDQQKFANQLQQGQQLSAIDQQRFGNQMQRGQQLGGFGQQQFGMGLQGGQGLAGLAGAQAGQLGTVGQQYAGMAQALPALQQQDIQSQMGMGGLGRGRSQSLMDLNYQNFVGQYNLPMQTLQNVGSLAAGLGPLAGGYGYAGATPTTNTAYTPSAPTTTPGIPSIYNSGFNI